MGLEPAPRFETLYSDHFDMVWRSLRHLGVAPAVLDDATQEVFMVVHRRLAEYRPRWSARAWLFAIARRVASDYRRSARRKGGLLPIRDTIAAPRELGPESGAERAQASRIIQAFLESLDDARRAAFVLAELEQMTAREIAQVLDENQSTIYSRVASARKALLVFLEQHHPDALRGNDG